MTPDDLEADTPALLRAMLAKSTLWQPLPAWALTDIHYWLWTRDEPECAAKHFGSGLPCPPLGWRGPYALALVASAILADWLVPEHRDWFASGPERWKPTVRAKTELGSVTGIGLLADPNMPKHAIMGIDYSAIEHRVMAQLAEQEPLKDFGFDVSALLAPDAKEATVTVLVKKLRKGPESPAFVVDSIDALKLAWEDKDKDG